MSRRIRHRTEFGHPAQRVHAALTDESCLRERLSTIGGRLSELLSYRADGGKTTVVMRQSIDAEDLPGIVRRVAPDGVTIERTEIWMAGDNGGYHGTAEAAVSGFNGSMHGTTTLADIAAGCEYLLSGQVKVGIPLIGGKIEEVVAEQLDRLLRTEARIPNRWLESQQG